MIISASGKFSLGVLLMLLALVAVSPARADNTPTFYKDPSTGCNVGTFAPEPGLSVRWSGPCVKGVAEGAGTVEWQKNGAWLDRSTGTYHSGLRDGQFTFAYPDGGTSVGAYQNGVPIPIFYVDPASHCSLGTFSNDTQLSVHWSGACNAGKAEGPGIAEWQKAGKLASRTEGNFHAGMAEGRALRIYADGRRIEGGYHNGQTNGHCVMTKSDVRVEGQCANDLFNGPGIAVFTNGNRYEGNFKDSTFNGQGVFSEKDGSRIEGEWLNNHLNGKGRGVYAGGDRYEGDFVNGKYEGKGTYYFADGQVYEGEWQDGYPNGRGIFHAINHGLLADGTSTFSGTWVSGCFHEGERHAAIFRTTQACGYEVRF